MALFMRNGKSIVVGRLTERTFLNWSFDNRIVKLATASKSDSPTTHASVALSRLAIRRSVSQSGGQGNGTDVENIAEEDLHV